MRRKTLTLIWLQTLLITNNLAHGKAQTKEKNVLKGIENSLKIERVKRNIDDEEDKPFWANRGKKQSEENKVNHGFTRNILFNPKELKIAEDEDSPFWGNRGRRFDSTSSEHKLNEYSESRIYPFDYQDSKICRYACFSPFDNPLKTKDAVNEEHFKERREESSPFWGNRGRRNSDETSEDDKYLPPSWDDRGRRQDDERFWANRGRREEELPFWGNRGRRQDDSPFWGARGRREEVSPFWGARGRRQDRQEELPFWGNRGRREEEPPFWGNRGRRKVENLKASITSAIKNVEEDIKALSRLRRSSSEPLFTIGTKTSFWGNRGRNSKLQYLFNDNQKNDIINYLNKNTKSPSTLYDDKIFVEQPHFILVDRSSRSASAEDDPFVISRGKKEPKAVLKAVRDRRGIIDIVKTVKDDPYYIARGKKDKGNDDYSANITITQEKFLKTKELICSTIELTNAKNKNIKVKREFDNDRDRRTILKKLKEAAALQVDPYMVSRGKKKSDENTSENDYEEFIMQVSEICN